MVIADLVDTLSRIGAIGGILSIVGVGLLILLVASQNRQIRSMREWIDEEPQRQQEVAQRVIAEVQRRIAAARERRSAAAAAPAAPSRPLPAAPGTLGATPEAQKVAASKELVPPGTVPAAEGDAAPEGPKFAPLTPAGGADLAEGSVPPPSADDDQPAVVSEFLGQETQAADALPDQDPVAARAPADVRFSDEHFDVIDDEPRGGSRMLFGVGVAALLAGIVLAFFLLFNGNGGDEPSAGDTPRASETRDREPDKPKSTTATPAPEPSSISVRVINGTQISGLAQRITDSLKAKGYATDSPGTLSDQTIQTTTVSYREGQKASAQLIAKDLGLSSGVVQAITTDLSVAAGETAEVVVLTGPDLDSTSSTTAE